MMKRNKILITVSFLALALTACGKNNYNGNYTGAEIKTPVAVSGQTQGYGGQSQYRQVSADLSHNGQIVTGTYNIVQPSYGQTQTPTTGSQETYRFEANANSSDKLEAVRLIPMNSYSGGCVLEGSLSAIENGRRLTGTLNPPAANYQWGGSTCMPTQVTLDRTGS